MLEKFNETDLKKLCHQYGKAYREAFHARDIVAANHFLELYLAYQRLYAKARNSEWFYHALEA
jgi:hypothetical protein